MELTDCLYESEVAHTTPNICPVCATVIPATFPEGMCLKCLLGNVVSEGDQVEDGAMNDGGTQPKPH